MSESVMESIAAKIENATYESIPSTGHLSPLESPVEWAQIVTDFLTFGVI
jgi:pimeloyl-ACP methyl ester carboxylesterase